MSIDPRTPRVIGVAQRTVRRGEGPASEVIRAVSASDRSNPGELALHPVGRAPTPTQDRSRRAGRRR